MTLNWLETVDSTNAHAWRTPWRSGVVWATDHQTHGKGRAGRAWESEQGASLCMSMTHEWPGGNPSDATAVAALPVVVGLALVRVLRQWGVSAQGVQLKWPNDVLYQGRKLAGVLCESVHAGDRFRLVIGVGVNLARSDWKVLPGALSPTSLEQAGVRCEGRERVLALASDIAAEAVDLFTIYSVHGLSAFLPDLHGLDPWVGRPVHVLDAGVAVMSGVALGINGQGAYRIRTEAGEQAVWVGDLSVRQL